MSEKPIPMCGEMVIATLEDRKTQTRRIVKMPFCSEGATLTRMQSGFKDGTRPVFGVDGEPNAFSVACPYGQPGRKLWVRETWKPHCDCDANGVITDEHPLGTCVKYRADGAMIKPDRWNEEQGYWCESNENTKKWRPSIFMPRWASRITLEITGVKVERLLNIKHNDALAEGVEYDVSKEDGSPLMRFRKLWDSINSKGSWASNPYVWVITFKRV